jgi:hypothetical protein
MEASFEVEYVNEEIIKLIHNIERPVHKVVLLGRIICSHVDCIAKKEFFHNNGIAHHFRVSHKQEWTPLRSESMNVARKLHEQETRECIEKVFEYRRTKVRVFYADFVRIVVTATHLLLNVIQLMNVYIISLDIY